MIYKVYSTNTRGEDDRQKEIQNIDAYLDEEWFLYECKQKKRFYPYAGIFAVGIALGLSDFIKNTFLEYELKMDNSTFNATDRGFIPFNFNNISYKVFFD